MEQALLDTNVLTSVQDSDYPKHKEVVRFLGVAPYDLCVAPQSLYEYWSVSTRPRKVNGLDRSPAEAWADIVEFRRTFTVLADPASLLDEWLDLCRTHGVSGKNAHDARLAAYARLNGISVLVTLNPRDFARYGLNVVVP